MNDRLYLIDIDGIEEGVRCTIYENQMKTDKGCDGNCKYDESLFRKITTMLETMLDRRIELLPFNQPEIVRCKDCKHWIPYDWMFSEVWQSQNIDDYPEDEIGCNYCDMSMKANDFCSRGERREDG